MHSMAHWHYMVLIYVYKYADKYTLPYGDEKVLKGVSLGKIERCVVVKRESDESENFCLQYNLRY